MAIFKCKMCGGALEINNNETVTTCEYCGTQQTLPKLDDDRRANLYDRANHFRRNSEFDKAIDIYEQILNEDNTDAEAYWSLVLCHYGIEYVEDPASHKRVPTVNRAQFTSVFDDENYISALQHADIFQRNIYEEEAKTINEIQKGILAISHKEEPFDVFICYKETDNNGRRTPDSVLANDLYHQLTQEGFKVFFARITLEDKLGSAYEPYIFAALNSAKIMVVLGTKPEYFKAVWVKNEWSRYLALIKQGQQKMLIPAYKDMDPYDLPEEFSHLQAQDMSKLGFMQDLIRGIKKIVQVDEPKVNVVHETVVTNVNSNVNTNVVPLLKRVSIFLADAEWTNANEYCEKVLDIDPENVEAYLGKAMAELKIRTRKELESKINSFEGNKYFEKAFRYADEQFKNELLSYKYNWIKKIMQIAVDEDSYKMVAKKFEKIIPYKDSEKLMKECLDKAEEKKEEERLNVIYMNAKKVYMKNPNELLIGEYQRAAEQFESIIPYKDSEELMKECLRKEEELKKLAIENFYIDAKRRLDDAKSEEQYNKAGKMFKSIIPYKDSEELMKECLRKEEELKKLAIENFYIDAKRILDKATSEKQCYKAEKMFKSIITYKDSKDLARQCINKAEMIMQQRIKDVEEEIKNKEEYLESLYHGHRCPQLIVLSCIVIIVGILNAINTFRNFNTLDRDMQDLSMFMLFFILISGIVGLSLSIGKGKPSSRPAIPITEDEIEELGKKLESLKKGIIPEDLDVKSENTQYCVDNDTDNIIAKGGWVCPDCNKANASYVGTCSCGKSRY